MCCLPKECWPESMLEDRAVSLRYEKRFDTDMEQTGVVVGAPGQCISPRTL